MLRSRRYDEGSGVHGGAGLATVVGSRVQGIILAGVHSWGHGALERVTCRPLLPIASRPLLARVAEWLGEAGVKEACVCGNSDTPRLRRCLGSGESVGLRLRYYEDDMPRGPAGCVHDAAKLGNGALLVVVEGTIVPRVDLSAVLRAHQQTDAALTMVVADDSGAGCASLEAGEPLGIYVISSSALEHVPAAGYQDLKEVLIPRLYDAGERVATFAVSADLAPRVTGAASYLAVSSWAIKRMGMEAAWQEGYRLVGESWVHHTAQVSDDARLIGSVMIGADSVVGPGAMLIGPTLIGAGCRVDGGVVVSRTVVWDRCQLRQGAIIDHSILTDDTIIGEQEIVRNTLWASPGPAPRKLKRFRRPARARTSNSAPTLNASVDCLKGVSDRKREGAGEPVGATPWRIQSSVERSGQQEVDSNGQS